MTAIDGSWLGLGHFRLDSGAFFCLGLLAALLMAGAYFYRTVRPDPRLAAMLFGAGFLCIFSCEASVLNYLLLTKAGGRIDMQLAALDRALGFDWPAAMRWMGHHPHLNALAFIAYSSMLPQVAVSIIVLAGIESDRVYRACMALALSALLCIAIWAFAPSFGAFSVYPLPDARLGLALDSAYAQELVRLLRDGPGLISPRDAKGLIGFPSYHAAMALLVIWYLRDVRILRWPVVALNLAVLMATPVQGGHHVIDVLAAFPVAALSIFVTARMARAAKIAKMVNKPSKSAEPVPVAAG
ncbi:MAG TPA: phosphatase PAP2 family protein [Rhizomicrobium sp.]|nr:phosphatase PAP2 family protein [Rhizomicrobium sp.]